MTDLEGLEKRIRRVIKDAIGPQIPNDGSIWPLATQPGGVLFRTGDICEEQMFQQEAYQIRLDVLDFWKKNRHLPNPPDPNDNPLTDLKNLFEWSIRSQTTATGNPRQDEDNRPLEIRVAEIVRNYDMKSGEIAKLLGLRGKSPDGQVRATQAWKNRKQLQSVQPQKGRKTRTDSSDGYSNSGGQSDVDALVDEPKAEHIDINEMITAYQNGKRDKYPTPEEIAERLSEPDDPVSVQRAKQLLKETKSIFGYDIE